MASNKANLRGPISTISAGPISARPISAGPSPQARSPRGHPARPIQHCEADLSGRSPCFIRGPISRGRFRGANLRGPISRGRSQPGPISAGPISAGPISAGATSAGRSSVGHPAGRSPRAGSPRGRSPADLRPISGPMGQSQLGPISAGLDACKWSAVVVYLDYPRAMQHAARITHTNFGTAALRRNRSHRCTSMLASFGCCGAK